MSGVRLRPVQALLGDEPPGLTPDSGRRWRIEALLSAGYGFEDVAVESRRWGPRLRPVTEDEARAVWADLGRVRRQGRAPR